MATAAQLPEVPQDASTEDVSLRHFPVTSRDGTRLNAWTNDVDGPTVLLCNGLGTNLYAWPAVLDPSCGVRVVSWNHRGTDGSDRPADPTHVGVEAFVEDALAVMDHEDIGACVLMGWSIGVNTMFEVAVQHPRHAVMVPGGADTGTGVGLSVGLSRARAPRPATASGRRGRGTRCG